MNGKITNFFKFSENWTSSIIFSNRFLDLLVFLFLAIGGFAYVAAFLTHRASPFSSAPGTEYDLLKVVGYGIFCWTVFQCIRYWQKKKNLSEEITQPTYPCCFIIPFLITLHWQYIPRLTGIDFSLSARGLSHLSFFSIIALCVATGCLFILVGFHLKLAYNSSLFKVYLFSLLAVIFLLPVIIWATHSFEGSFHFHHYNIGAFLFPFASFSNRLSTLSRGFLFGLLVEGVARWGADPMFV